MASVSSIANSDNEALVYTLSGTGSNKFTVNASTGAITTASALDFEEARTYNLTLTATGQTTGTTASSAITVPVKNVEEMQSMTLRYSPVALSPSRTGFSATATRDGGPSGTNLGNFTQEQVVTAAAATADSKYLTSYHNGSNMTTPVSIDRNDGVKYDTTVDNFDFKYFYPIGATAGAGQYQFSPGQQALDGHYKTVGAQSQVTLDVTQSEVVSAGRLSSGKVYWMVTDKNAATMNFNSRQSNAADVDVLFLHNNGASNTSMSDDWGWKKMITAYGMDFSHSFDTYDAMQNVADDLDDYEIIIDHRYSGGNTNDDALFENWMKDDGSLLYVKMFSERCCGGTVQETRTPAFLQTIGGGITISGDIDEDGTSGNYGGIVDANLFASDSFYYGLNGFIYDPFYMGKRLSAATNGQLLFNKAQDDGDANLYAAAYFKAEDLESGVNADMFIHNDFGGIGGSNHTTYYINQNNEDIVFWLFDQNTLSDYSSQQYHTYNDQITLTGNVFTDAMYNSFTSSNKRIIALNAIPIENHLASGTNDDFFYPSFFPSGMYSSSSMDFKTLGPDYCAAVGNNTSTCNTYANNYDWAEQLLDLDQTINISRFEASGAEMPEGTSQWYQVLNPAGKGVGLQAQLSIQDTYDGAGGSTTRDDQQSYLGVMISSIDKRSNDTTRYTVGDTGQQLEGNHYWSYQKRTNATNDGLGVQLGSTPIECATSYDMGCFLGRDNNTDNRPLALMATSSDPYKNGDMTLGVKYDSNSDSWATDTINQMVASNAISGRLSSVKSAVKFDWSYGDYLTSNTNCADNTCAIYSLEAGDAFAVSTLFYLPESDGNQTHPLWGTKWSSGNGNSDSGEVYMEIENNQIRFGGGRMASNWIKFNGSDNLTEGQWYGLYLTYDGGTLAHYNEFGCCMTIK
ncbi:MAG: cadherin repeat domain-containing protein, partial [Gammaproteobacteria bacterium]|nr:cadherin repeat domain-containing protein [Gammaproteobacteria bacterium]